MLQGGKKYAEYVAIHSGPELIKNAKTIHSLHINILYILWAKEFISEVDNALKKI